MIDMTDPFFIDKWYSSSYGVGGKTSTIGFDYKAAELMGFERPSNMPENLHNFARPIVDLKGVLVPKITEDCVINKSAWNHPRLIEAFEATNPGKKFTRDAVREAIYSAGIRSRDVARRLDSETICDILTSTENKASHKLVKMLLIKEDGTLNSTQVLDLLGLDTRLIEVLGSVYKRPELTAEDTRELVNAIIEWDNPKIPPLKVLPSTPVEGLEL